MEAWNLDYEECIRLVHNEWTEPVSGSATVRMIRKLSRARNCMCLWSISKRKEWNKKWSDFDDNLVEGLHEIETKGVTRTFTTAFASQVEYAKVSAKYWKQRAKMKWNTKGDTCSKYFFNWVKGRAGRNYIAGIKMDNGEWNFDGESIKGLFVQFYSRLFQEGANQINFEEYRPTVKDLFSINKEFLSPDDRDALDIRFTPKEVRTAVFQLGPLKSPGPDGIPAIFFHKCWHFIKHDAVGTVLAILNGNSSPEFLNKTFLVLIPKSSAPETVDNFRPISLCNVIMKVITRCITNRLKKYMGKLVGDFQNAFVPGRNISDNILITNEILHKISSSRSGRMGRMAFKADMSKAYDRLDWNFIRGNSKSCESLDKVIKDYCHASGQVRKRLSSWNCILLSPAGRLALISSVLSSLSVYFLSVFKIPVSVTKRLDAILSHFWWAGHKKSPSISWCSRLFLSQSKRNGGLGIRRMKEFNQALLAKIGWRMITHPNSILCKSIGAKYGLRWCDGDLLFNDGKSNSSWGWKGIVWGLQLIKPLLAWNFSPSSDLGVWNSKWVHGTVPRPRCVELLTDSPNLCNLRIKDLICERKRWDHRLVSMSFDETSIKNILAIPIRCSDGSDTFYWSASSSGNYSVKIGYHIALQNHWNSSASPKDRSRVPAAYMGVFQKILWNLPGPKSWIILLWKLLTESLPTGEGFLRRGFDGPFTCVLCDSQETESGTLLPGCFFANAIWADNKIEACLSFLCTFWTIWVVRCRRIFESTECSPIGAIFLYQDSLNLALSAEDGKSGSMAILTLMEEDLTNLRNGEPFPLIQSSVSCSRSHIYVDAAWSKELAAGFGGCILFDNDIVSEFCIKGMAENAEQAEALAIREALKWALSRNILHVNIFSDCLQVLAQILRLSQLKHWTRNTIDDITDLAANFHCVTFAYVPRICNKAAHRIAKRAINL
ncbi:uncharacterized protein LOC141601995 [Silene latifolia]|uniref:uncharacterized protein LOC141601995 n=1 Tax=Silene latifolia TaxID=37657 RepID=UPI003D772676